MNATRLEDLINFKGRKEPLLPCSVTKEEVMGFGEKPIQVPFLCLHTQGVERMVKEVTNASWLIYGFERRDGFVRERAENRTLMPTLHNKNSLANLLSYTNREVGVIGARGVDSQK